ncbi:hypothetical protein SLEP1_g55001 [Rubroshorea leprosula]|uniref:Sucrose-phosphatase C-terminal domain-containing protein n=1 Tax=Rubroshorea leprosula TaxID=152421 RepID=A0AAV5MGN2_9ROSI|nr:hypothetical protein SLEP1_g55001 [Rubroshorea leprosula]
MDWLSASARPMIVSYLDHTMVDYHDVENVSLFCMLYISCPCENKKSLDPSAVTVRPSGVEKPLHERIHELKGWYGDKQGKRFRVWVDCVLSTQTGSSTWLVNFHKVGAVW